MKAAGAFFLAKPVRLCHPVLMENCSYSNHILRENSRTVCLPDGGNAVGKFRRL
jgi:hypothetical protein